MPDTTVRIEVRDPIAVPDWDLQLATWPNATFFHTQAWARVLRDVYGLRPLYFMARRAARVAGIQPLMEVSSWITGRRGVGLPFTDYCETLATDEAVRTQLVDAAIGYGRTHGWKYCEMRDRPDPAQSPASISFYGHSLDVNRAPDALLAACDPATRRAIRKAERENVTVAFGHTPEALDAFFALVCRTRRRQGLPPQPRRFFDEIHRQILLAGNGCIVLAYRGEQAVAGAMFFHFGPTALFKFGASNEAYQQLRANNLLMWRAIEWHANAGFARLDFGRTSRHNDGLRRFKRGWGTREYDIEYVRCNCRTGEFIRDRDCTRGWHTEIFKHLPPAVARLVGAAAYKHIA